MQVGDLVTLKKNRFGIYDGPMSYHHGLVGIVVDIGTEERRMYGDGILYSEYADVKWLDQKYERIARYSPPRCTLEIISENRKPS